MNELRQDEEFPYSWRLDFCDFTTEILDKDFFGFSAEFCWLLVYELEHLIKLVERLFRHERSRFDCLLDIGIFSEFGNLLIELQPDMASDLRCALDEAKITACWLQ